MACDVCTGSCPQVGKPASPQVRPLVLTRHALIRPLARLFGRSRPFSAAPLRSPPDIGAGSERVFLSLSVGAAGGDAGRPGGEVPRDERRCAVAFIESVIKPFFYCKQGPTLNPSSFTSRRNVEAVQEVVTLLDEELVG